MRHLRARAASLAWSAIVVAGWLGAPWPALAAEPTPSPLGGDPRSSGEGPGLVGDPLVAIAAVVLIALVAVVGTTLWVRATGGRHRDAKPPEG